MANEEIARGTVILEVELNQREIDARIDALADRITNTLIKAATTAGNAISGIGNAARTVGPIIGNALQGAANLGIKALQGIGKAAGAVFGQLANVAKVGALAIAGLGGTALVTGAQFNILQQTVRGALIAILQSEDAALKLLAAVNELNDASPFARSVFLQLTQTLAGFGVEAEKIPGVLDAIQQAVAATGGGEDDLLALGQAIARVASEGRLTGDVLQSFSARGVDVIELLADAAGKTGQQIREDISNGAIGATEAIDTLTTALTERFAGATESVSKNFPGALDRINARLRDMGAALTKIFIDPIGGGALVQTMNDISTAISAFTKIVVPLLQPALQRVADLMNEVSGRVRVFAERFTLLADGSKKTATELAKITSALGTFLEPLKSLLPLMAGLVGFFPLLLRDLPIVGNLLSGLGGPVTALIAALATIPEVRQAFVAFAESLRPLVSSLLPQFTAFMSQLTTAIIPIVTALFDALGQVIGVLATTVFPALLTVINTLVTSLGPVVSQVFSVLATVITSLATNAFPPLIEILNILISSIGPFLVEFLQALEPALEELGPHIGELVAGFIPLALAMSDLLIALTPLIPIFGDLLVAAVKVAGLNFDFLVAAIKGAELNFRLIVETVKFLVFQVRLLADATSFAIGFLQKIPIVGRAFKDAGSEVEKSSGFFTKAGEAARGANSSFQSLGTGLAKVPEVITKSVNPALKAAKDNVKTLADQIKTSLDGLNSKFSEVFTAAANLTTATKGLTSANDQLAVATQTVLTLEASRAQVIANTIDPLLEIQIAEEALAEGRGRLRDIDQDIIATQERLAELRTPATANELAAADRDIARANIALNDALRAQTELREGLNEEQEASIDLAGLSLDQLQDTTANARASAAAQRAATKKTGKTQQEIDDAVLTAQLTVEEAKERVRLATEAKLLLEDRVLNNAIAIREEEEKLEGLAITKTRETRTQEGLQTNLNTLLAGANTQAAALKVLDDQITKAKQDEKTAAEGVATATEAVRLATIENQLATATILGDSRGILDAQTALLIEKAKQPGISDLVLAKLREELGVIQTQRTELTGLQGQLETISAIKPLSVITAGPGSVSGITAGGAEAIVRAIGELNKSILTGGTASIRNIEELAKATKTRLPVPNAEGSLITKPTLSWIGEGTGHELILPMSKPNRVWDLVSQHLPRYPGAMAAVQSAVLPSRPAPARISIAGAGGASSAAAQRKANKELAQAIAEELVAAGIGLGGSGETTITIPVTTPVPDPRLLAREIDRRINNNSMRR